MTDRAKAVHNYIFDHKNDFLSYLQFLVEEETPSDKPDTFFNIQQRLTESFEELSFEVEFTEGKETAGQMLCKPKDFNSNTPSQLILGHIDTVWDLGTLDEMPFTIDGNIVSGPGIFDMKTGICMMVFAMRAVQASGETPPVQPIFVINSDEEIGSNESKPLFMEQAKIAERTFVLEPSLGTDGKIKTARKGIGLFEIELSGKPSHAGLDPEEGVSAILGLSHIVQELFELNDPKRGVSVNVGTIEGGERSNVIAAKSKAVIDVRVPTQEDGEHIKEKIYQLESHLEGIELKVSGDISRPPMEKEQANEKLWHITKELGDELDLELQEGTSGGGSDGNFTNLHSPTIDGLGGVGEGAHAYHEKIFLKESIERTALLSLLILHPSIDFGIPD